MKAILFDFDGTLVDSQHWYDVAISKHLLQFNTKYTHEYCSKFINGRCWYDAFDIVAKEEGFDKNIILGKALADAQELIAQNANVTNGTMEALDSLDKMGIVYAICSNASKNEIEFILNKTHLDKYFPSERIFARNMVKNGKPSSDVYLLGLKSLGLHPSQTFAVEDSLNGAKASINAEIKTLIFTGSSSFNSKEKFYQEFGQDTIFFDNMLSVVEYVNNA